MPLWPEHAPLEVLASLYVPSLQRNVAPAGAVVDVAVSFLSTGLFAAALVGVFAGLFAAEFAFVLAAVFAGALVTVLELLTIAFIALLAFALPVFVAVPPHANVSAIAVNRVIESISLCFID
jgi:hypothetical protein